MTRPDADKSKEQCEDCRYWTLSEDYREYKPPSWANYAIGWCKRYPPSKYMEQVGFSIHHETENDDWCGEFKAKDKPSDEILARSVRTMNLSVRSWKALKRAEVDTIAKLTEKSEYDLLCQRNFGQTSLWEVKKNLADLGLRLKD